MPAGRGARWGSEGQEPAAQSSHRQSVSNARLAATLEPSLPFGAAARRASGLAF